MAEVRRQWEKFVNSATLMVLKEKLKDLNVATTGNKPDVLIRLRETVKDFSEEELSALIPDGFDETASGSSQSVDYLPNEEESVNDELVRLQNLIKKKKEIADLRKQLRELEVDDVEVSSRAIGHTFKDMEEAIPAYSGDDTYPIQRWINQFEESAEILKLDERSKFIYSKRLLTGSAKSLMRSVSLKSWSDVKQALLKEFANAVTQAEIHNELRSIRKANGETMQQYVLRVQEIASLVSICEEDIMYYIIKGIPDSDSNKLLLYNANSLDELKLALRKYEKMKFAVRDTNATHQKPYSQMHKKSTNRIKSINGIKCYNCNEMGHLSRQCTKARVKELICFKCKQVGHTSTMCFNKNPVMTVHTDDLGTENNFQTKDQCTCKSADQYNEFQHQLKYVFYNEEASQETSLLTLLDSGSPISIIQQNNVPNFMTTVAAGKNSYFGINGSPLNILGKISIKICYKNLLTDLDLNVVDSNTMIYPVVLGRDFLAKNNLVLETKNENKKENESRSKGEEENENEGTDNGSSEGSSMHVCFSNKSTVSKENEFLHQILNIDINSNNIKDENVLKMNDNLPYPVKKEIENIIEPARFIDTNQVPNVHNNFKMRGLATPSASTRSVERRGRKF